MRVSELARETGVSIPTIKYYLREGLLRPGALRAPNQATYDERHVRRLRLIRILLEIGGLSIARVRIVLAAIDDPRVPVHEMLGVAHSALAIDHLPDAPDDAAATSEVDAFLASLGWRVAAGTPARGDLASALAALRRVGWPASAAIFQPYADAVDQLAAREVAFTLDEADRETMIERVVVGTVVFDVVLSALRRLAQEHHSARGSAAAGRCRRSGGGRSRR